MTFVSEVDKWVYQLHIKYSWYFQFWQINWVKLLFRRDLGLFISDRNIYHHRKNTTKWKRLLFLIGDSLRDEKPSKTKPKLFKKASPSKYALTQSGIVSSVLDVTAVTSCRVKVGLGPLKWPFPDSSVRTRLQADAAKTWRGNQQHVDVSRQLFLKMTV